MNWCPLRSGSRAQSLRRTPTHFTALPVSRYHGLREHLQSLHRLHRALRRRGRALRLDRPADLRRPSRARDVASGLVRGDDHRRAQGDRHRSAKDPVRQRERLSGHARRADWQSRDLPWALGFRHWASFPSMVGQIGRSTHACTIGISAICPRQATTATYQYPGFKLRCLAERGLVSLRSGNTFCAGLCTQTVVEAPKRNITRSNKSF